jgi:4-amino-4-deoxy-L-arabinose transferase-like glycosyltransferase
MIDTDKVNTTLTTPQDEAEQAIAQRGKKGLLAWHRLALVGIMLISVVMNFYQLGKNGFGSYYPAAIRSMLDSWHNFFFVAYDPGGFVSIDKPPVGFWLEAASAKLFGFNAVSILLP